MTVEFTFLYAIQDLNNAFWDPIMIFFSTIGNNGMVWIGIAFVFLMIKRHRETGFAMAIALLLSLIVCNLVLKNIVQRPRPFWIDEQIVLKIEAPGDFSFPSGHTFSSFAAAVAIFLCNRKFGCPALVLAASIAFSRLYLFVHYPTDVLASVVLGSCAGFLAVVAVRSGLNPIIRKAGRIAPVPETIGENDERRHDEIDTK